MVEVIKEVQSNNKMVFDAYSAQKKLKIMSWDDLWKLQDLIDNEIEKRAQSDTNTYSLALKDYISSLSQEEQQFMQMRVAHPKSPVKELAEKCNLSYSRALDLVKNSSFQSGMRYELTLMGWSERKAVRTLLNMTRTGDKNSIEAVKMLLKLCEVDIETKKQPSVQITKNTQINTNNVNVLERLEGVMELYENGERR